MELLADTDAQILVRIVSPEAPALSAEGAKELLALDFPNEDRQRMNQLASKAREGTLTPDEQSECESYERIGHFLSLLHSRARIALRHAVS
jgi:hypothetical protein